MAYIDVEKEVRAATTRHLHKQQRERARGRRWILWTIGGAFVVAAFIIAIVWIASS